MAIFGSSFTYNGKSSDDFGVIICASEQPESIPMGLTREILKGEITSRRPVSNWYNTKYSDVLTFEVTITKPENRAFSREEIRDINAWLTGPRTPTLLFFEDEAFDPINYYGVFTDVTNVYGSGILMLTYTFTADSPYGWSTNLDNGSLGLYWVRLVPGVNKFKITGGCSIKMTFRCPRKVGAY